MAFRLLPIAASLAVMGQVALPGMLVGEARAQHVAATAVPQGNVTTYGNAVGYQVAAGANGNVTASITQSANTNVVNWQSFDIGRNATVSIRQPSASAVLLNNVQGGAYLGKTTIEGMLNANGRVYIYNPNGVLIGSTAQVNVDTLIASSLKFDVARVVSGLIQKSSTPVLAADLALGVPGNVEVEAGAMVKAGSQILLAAPHVVNNGSLSAPDGQVVLAAGGKVFLAAPATTPGVPNNLRGVVVEVSNDNLAGSPGSADNNGSINVGHGNATMVGYAVNQNGIVSASTSVSQNGSIFLYARDQATIPDASSGAIVPGRSGRLVLGEGSTTEVKLDTADTATLPATTAFNPSVVDLNGADIQLLENAKIVAPGGTVTLRAQAVPLPQAQGSPYTPDATRPLNLVNSVQVSMAPGSQIDVSGNTDTQLPMESNLISVNLRGTELADNPVLRDSSLYGSTVQIDARTGTAAANVTGWLNLVGHTVGELASAGGKVGISSDGAILQSAGSSIKADGGWVQYLPGYVNTSRLMLNGQLVDIGSAQSGVAYTAVVNAGDALYPAEQWQPGYVQGNHAGTIQIAAPLVALQGSLSAKATPGIYQRDVAASSATPRELSNASDSVADAGYLYFQNLSHVRPKGGDLLLGNTGTGPLSTDLRNYPYPAHSTPGSFIPSLAADVTLRAASASSAVSLPEAGTALSATEEGRLSDLNLDPTTLFTKDGFSAVRIATSGNIEVADVVTLPPGGALSLTAQAGMVLDPSGNYRQALGDIAFTAGVSGAGASVSATAANSLTVAPGLGFDLAGTWTNDQYAAGPAMDGDGRYTTPDVQRGGSLSLSANQLSIGDGVSVDVSAGAWANSAGKLAQGSGGSISFSAVPLSLTGDPFNESLHLGSGLSLKAYGFTAGGTLKLVGRNVTLGGDASGVGTNDVWLSAAFFQQGGFTSYDIEANGNLTVAANASIQPMADAWNFNAGYGTVGSGGMASVASPYRFELAGRSGVRSATHLKLQALAGQGNQAGSLLVDHGASVRLDPGATLTLLAGRQLTDYGSLIAPGGTIRLGLSGVTGFRAERSIWFGADARVIAAGSTARLFTDSGGVSSGSLLSGGSIRIGGDLSPDGSGTLLAAPGYVVAEAGSVFDVSGALAKDVQLKSGGSITPAQDLGSAGGSIEIRTSPGLLFAATLRGQGGGGAAGGSLTVDMDQGGMQTGFYAFAGPATLTITSASASSLIPSFTIKNADGSTTAGLAPGQALIVQSPNTGDWMLNDGTADGSSKKTLGMGWIAASGFRGGGFSQLAFRSPDTLAFGLGSANLSLAAQDSLILDAPYFKADVLSNTPYGSGGHTLSLSAAYVQLGTTRSSSYPTDPVLGNGKLVVNANTIELIGDTRLQGFSDAKLAAAGDVRLVGRRTSDAAGKDTVNSAQGSFGLVGNLSIQSAQTYPTTLSDFTLMALPNVVANADGSRTLSLGQLTFSGNGTTAQAPLSAAGRLNVLARDIMQGGTVLAPFGVINMGGAADTRIANPNWDANDPSTQYYLTTNLATRSLEYLPGSLTSVAGSGTVPFGTMVNGAVSNAATWNVTLPDGVSQATFDLSNPLPAKAINSVAEVVKSDAGSVLDASGGGRLVAYEFTAGRLGSSDILNNDGASATVFAIIPGFQGAVAPVDGSYGGAVKNTVTNSTYYADGNIKADGGGAGNGSDGGLKAGDSVYLSGMSGLPAGTYTLLPAHYALMAGAYTVTVRAGTQDMLPQNNSVLADGSLLVSGNRLESVSGKALGTTRSSGFVVTPQSVLTAQAQSAAAGYQKYTLYDADSYFGSLAKAAKVVAPELPTDGGSIAFTSSATGSSALVLNGTLRLGGASGGRAGSAAFSADKIEVVAAAGQGAADAVKLLAGKLTGLAAESLLIQGRSVTVSNNAATPLSAAEVTLNAAESLVLAPGAVVAGSGTLNRSPLTLPASQGGARIQATGLYADGSLPYLSIPDWATAGTPSGTLDLGAGANFGGSASVLLAAGNRVGVAPGFDLKIADGGALAVGARNPSLDADTARALSGLSSLAMDSYGTAIGLYGSFVLGSRDVAGKYNLANLSFKASGFQQHGGTDDLVALSAASVRLEGSGAPVAANPVAHGGSLTIQAGTIKLGDNGFALRGFQDAALSADGEMLAVGRSGALVADYDLTLSAARFGTANAAAGLFAAGGDLTLLGNSATVAARAGMGGQLSFQAGNDLKSTANITLPSGKISMRAGNDLDIAGGMVSAAGLGVSFADTSAYGPGGSIGLAGGNSVTLETAATLDVSATGAQAGALSIQAGDGGVTLAGQLDGRAVAAPGGSLPAQGRFSLDSSYTNGDFGALNDLLNASHFTESRTFRYRNGDVELNAGDTVTAHEVSITADNGNILVHGGALDASGAKGGSIELYASQSAPNGRDGRVVLESGALLDAHATQAATSDAGSTGNGGRVVIGVGNADGSAPADIAGGASMDLAGGTINVAGMSASGGVSRDGTVLLRAPRVGNDVAIARLATGIQGSSNTAIEAYQTYETASISTGADSVTNLNATQAGKMYRDAEAFAANAAAIATRLGMNHPGGGNRALAVRPGIEVRSSGDLTVSVNEFAAHPAQRGWNLQDWRFEGQPINLSLRAAGTLSILGSISDGFAKPSTALSMPDWQLTTGPSASYRLVGGADLMSANPLAVTAGTGGVSFGFADRTPTSDAPLTNTDAPVALVRTGTGSIDVASGGNVSLALAKFYRNSSTDLTLDGTPLFSEGSYRDGSFDVPI
jgi:filamentous hemagglutinin family protein